MDDGGKLDYNKNSKNISVVLNTKFHKHRGKIYGRSIDWQI